MRALLLAIKGRPSANKVGPKEALCGLEKGSRSQGRLAQSGVLCQNHLSRRNRCQMKIGMVLPRAWKHRHSPAPDPAAVRPPASAPRRAAPASRRRASTWSRSACSAPSLTTCGTAPWTPTRGSAESGPSYWMPTLPGCEARGSPILVVVHNCAAQQFGTDALQPRCSVWEDTAWRTASLNRSGPLAASETPSAGRAPSWRVGARAWRGIGFAGRSGAMAGVEGLARRLPPALYPGATLR